MRQKCAQDAPRGEKMRKITPKPSQEELCQNARQPTRSPTWPLLRVKKSYYHILRFCPTTRGGDPRALFTLRESRRGRTATTDFYFRFKCTTISTISKPSWNDVWIQSKITIRGMAKISGKRETIGSELSKIEPGGLKIEAWRFQNRAWNHPKRGFLRNLF